VLGRAWGSGDPPMKSGDIACVWDFGGGTLDISILEIRTNEGNLSLRAIANLGRYLTDEDLDVSGNRVDERVLRYLAEREGWEIGSKDWDPVKDKGGSILTRLRRRALDAVRRAKEQLNTSADDDAPDRVELKLLRVQLEKQELDDLVIPDVLAAISKLRAVMGVSEESRQRSIDHFFLVGGSSLLSVVPELIGDAFPGAQVIRPPSAEDAVLAVARGAVLAHQVRIENVLGFRVLACTAPGATRASREIELFGPTTLLPARREELLDPQHFAGPWSLLLEHGEHRWRVALFMVPSPVGEGDRVALSVDIDVSGMMQIATALKTAGTQEDVGRETVSYAL